MNAMWIATVAETREIERLAETEYGLSPEVLMENAGASACDVAEGMLAGLGRLIVVCGKGNNGGDGFVVARHARSRGHDVSILVTSTRKELSPLAALNCARAESVGLVAQFCDTCEFEGSLQGIDNADLIVDAMLGTGFSGTLSGTLARIVDALNACGAPVLSLDVPSGLEADSGSAQGPHVHAARTVTFGLPKPFLFQGHGATSVGEWTVSDIGLPHELLNRPLGARFIQADDVRFVARAKDANKGDNGHVLIVAGSSRFRGAATIAALGALNSGAGLVTVASIEPVVQSVAAQVPEAVFVVLPEDNGAIAADASASLLAQMGRVSSAVFGPGLTTSESVHAFLEHLWQAWDIPSVIDADALNLVSKGLALPKAKNLLTPHPGEAGRLLGMSAQEVQEDRFGCSRRLQRKFGAPVILKGAYSVSAAEGAPLSVNPTGNPGMATGGMGDVLAGILGTLHQPGSDPLETMVNGAYLHGLAGDMAAQEIGQIGFSATDLAQFLPRARSILTK